MLRIVTISSFRGRLSELLKVRRGVYAGVDEEINDAFHRATIEEIRINRNMILDTEQFSIIKLRLADKKHRLSKKDGYRLIYIVSKTEEKVVLLDIYPKNGPLQKLSIDSQELQCLLTEFVNETDRDILKPFAISTQK